MSSQPQVLWIIAILILIVCIVRIGVGVAAADKRLLSACLGSRDQANRLIAFEMQRNPNLSRRKAASMALERIKRDNH